MFCTSHFLVLPHECFIFFANFFEIILILCVAAGAVRLTDNDDAVMYKLMISLISVAAIFTHSTIFYSWKKIKQKNYTHTAIIGAFIITWAIYAIKRNIMCVRLVNQDVRDDIASAISDVQENIPPV